MHILKTHYKETVIIVLILLLYFVFRLPNLTYQPIFADEAIYIRWAQVMKSEPTLRFLPLSDGKTPLFMWIMMPSFKIFDDPLYTGRILSIISGLGTLSGIFLLGRIFFNKRTAYLAAFLIATTPYIFFFDRMALVDSMLAAFTVWSILAAFLLVKLKRIDLAIILGFLLGGGLLTKTPGMFNVLMVPLAALTMNFSPKGRVVRALKLSGLFILAIIISQGIYNLLRLGPGFVNLNSRNADYVRDPSDLLKNPLDPFVPHFNDLVEWWPLLLGYPVIIALIIGLIFAVKKRNLYAISIFLFALGPLLVQMALLRTFTARYLLFSMPPLLLISAYGLDNLLEIFKRYKTTIIGGVLLILLFWPLNFAWKLHTDIENTPLPKNERRGYLEDWTAGTGLREIAREINDFSKSKKVIVATEGTFGTLPDGLQIYFDKNSNVTFWPGTGVIDPLWRAEAQNLTVFFVANKSRLPAHTDGVEQLGYFPKTMPLDSKYEQDATVFWKILP